MCDLIVWTCRHLKGWRLVGGLMLAPLALRHIEAPNVRLLYSWFPVILGLAAGALEFVAPQVVTWGGNGSSELDGVVHGVTGLVQTVSGFYITALSVIAGMSSSKLDGRPASAFKLDGQDLSRRRFLGYLFAHLTTVSFVLYGIGVALDSTATSELLSGSDLWLCLFGSDLWLRVAKSACISAYFAVVAQLALLTQFGLYFIVEQVIPAAQAEVPSVHPLPTNRPERTADEQRAADEAAKPAHLQTGLSFLPKPKSERPPDV